MIPRKKNELKLGATLLLHDIRSIHNVGSIFRTADGCGVEKIYISGHTPAPIDRFGRKRADMAKVALGAEDSVKWEVVDTNTDAGASMDAVVDFIVKQKKAGIRVIALEQDEKSVDLQNMSKTSTGSLAQSTLLILGNEVGGISREILDLVDVIAEIPMHGKKESLNVSVAAGIAMYQLFSNR
jgi:tRNA G18 (ribose-2'-O)-methylase SpoU